MEELIVLIIMATMITQLVPHLVVLLIVLAPGLLGQLVTVLTTLKLEVLMLQLPLPMEEILVLVIKRKLVPQLIVLPPAPVIGVVGQPAHVLLVLQPKIEHTLLM
jgi:hypothetical protein